MRAFIGVDGSDGGWDAVQQASSVLSPSQDQIALYYAPPQKAFRRRVAPAQTVLDETRQLLVDNVLDEAIGRLPPEWRDKVEKIVGNVPPRQGLMPAAENWNADLIAVGAHGASTLSGLVLGSVAKSIVHGTNKPVLVARRKRDKRSDSTYSVLLAVDDLATMTAPVEFLKKLSWPDDSSGRLIHVVPPMFGAEVPEWLESRALKTRDRSLSQAWVDEFEAEKRDNFNELAAYSQQLPRPFAGNAPILLEGIPADKVVETAIADDIDLVIVLTHDVSSLQRLLLGSTADKILQHSPCSVLVLHVPVAT